MKSSNLIDLSILENSAVDSLDHQYFKDCSYENSHIQRVTAKILDNVGFSTATQSCILILSSIFKQYYEMLCSSTHQYANFGLFILFLNFSQNS